MPRNSKLRVLRVYLPLFTTLLAPFLLGSVHTVIVCILVTALLMAFWAEKRVRRHIVVPSAAYVLLALIIFLIITLLPLPPSVVRFISPQTAEIWEFSAGGIGAMTQKSWISLSLSPGSTWIKVLHHIGALLAFVVGASVFAEYRRHKTLAMSFGLVGGGLALIVGIHWLFSLQAVYGFYPVSKNILVGPFINPNHLAAFCSFAGILALSFLIPSKQSARLDKRIRLALVASCVFCFFLVFVTQSRGGIASLGFGVLLFAIFELRARAVSKQVWIGLILCLFVGSFVGFTYFFPSFHSVSQDIKVQVWQDALALTGDFWSVGVGRGAFGDVFPQYQSFSELFYVRSAEMLPLSILSEIGIVGLLLCTVLGYVFWPAIRKGSDPIERAIAVASITLVIHDLADFSLDVAGVAFPAALILGALCGRYLKQHKTTNRRTHKVFFFTLSVVSLVFLLGTPWAIAKNPERTSYELEELSLWEDVLSQTRQFAAYRPSDGYIFLQAAAQALALNKPLKALPFLNRARFLLPKDPRAHLLSARVFRRVGRFSQARLEYRAAFEYRPPLAGKVYREWFNEALSLAESCHEVQALIPRQKQGRYLLIDALTQANRTKEALHILWGLVAKDPSNANDWYLLGEKAISIQAFDEALAAIKALEKLRDDRVSRLIDLVSRAQKRP